MIRGKYLTNLSCVVLGTIFTNTAQCSRAFNVEKGLDSEKDGSNSDIVQAQEAKNKEQPQGKVLSDDKLKEIVEKYWKNIEKEIDEEVKKEIIELNIKAFCTAFVFFLIAFIVLFPYLPFIPRRYRNEIEVRVNAYRRFVAEKIEATCLFVVGKLERVANWYLSYLRSHNHQSV